MQCYTRMREIVILRIGMHHADIAYHFYLSRVIISGTGESVLVVQLTAIDAVGHELCRDKNITLVYLHTVNAGQLAIPIQKYTHRRRLCEA
jgi:hypothetical protein